MGGTWLIVNHPNLSFRNPNSSSVIEIYRVPCGHTLLPMQGNVSVGHKIVFVCQQLMELYQLNFWDMTMLGWCIVLSASVNMKKESTIANIDARYGVSHKSPMKFCVSYHFHGYFSKDNPNFVWVGHKVYLIALSKPFLGTLKLEIVKIIFTMQINCILCLCAWCIHAHDSA